MGKIKKNKIKNLQIKFKNHIIDKIKNLPPLSIKFNK